MTCKHDKLSKQPTPIHRRRRDKKQSILATSRYNCIRQEEILRWGGLALALRWMLRRRWGIIIIIVVVVIVIIIVIVIAKLICESVGPSRLLIFGILCIGDTET